MTATKNGRTAAERQPFSSGSSIARATLIVLSLTLGVAVVLWALYQLAGILLLLVLAVFFAYLVAPAVARARRGVTVAGRTIALSLPAAIGATYALVFGSIAAACILILPAVDGQLRQLAHEAPGYVTRLRISWQTWQVGYRSHAFPPELRDAIDSATRQAVTAGGTYATNDLLPRLVGWLVYLPWLILVPILAFFLLKDAEIIRKSVLRFLPRGILRSRGDVFLVDLNDTLAAYIRAQVTACLLVGLSCTIGFFAIGVPYAIVLGIAAGALEFIPLAGPLTIGVVATSVAAFRSAGQAVAVLLFLLVLRAVQDYVVYPKIVGPDIHLRPLVVILAILSGAELGGLAGIFLAIPAVAVLTLATTHYRKHVAAASRNGTP